jgi:dTDP-4-dehydrorhamnose 3,5-epimerase-like enzyme
MNRAGAERNSYYQNQPEQPMDVFQTMEEAHTENRADRHQRECGGGNQIQFVLSNRHLLGFCVLSLRARVHYKCSDFYAPKDEGGILWSDPDLGIDWPTPSPIVSEKDRAFPTLAQLNRDQLPGRGKTA